MLLKHIIFTSECTATSLALCFNMILLYLIHKKTPDEIKLYAKILRQNSLVDTFFTIAIGMTFYQIEITKGECILLQGGFFRKIPHPWNQYMISYYIAALYFCISSDIAPFFYRYMLIVKGRQLNNFEFYAIYVVTGTLSSIVSVWLYLGTYPSTTPEMQLHYQKFLDDFYQDANGNYSPFIASHLNDPFLIMTVLWAMGVCTTTYGFITYFAIKTIKHLKLNKTTMTEKTRKLQKQLTITLGAQAIAPMILAVGPVMMILSAMLFDFNVPHLGVVCISMVSWIAVLNPLFVIVLVGPYRDAILGRKRQARLKHTFLKWTNTMMRRPTVEPATTSSKYEFNPKSSGTNQKETGA